MSRHLFVIEGTDGSGKSTQAALTVRALQQNGVDFTRLTFPRYQEESSALLRMSSGGRMTPFSAQGTRCQSSSSQMRRARR